MKTYPNHWTAVKAERAAGWLVLATERVARGVRVLTRTNMKRTQPSEIRVATERGANTGLLDAKRAGDPDFEPTPNPYGVDSEPALHEAWETGYENTFEASR